MYEVLVVRGQCEWGERCPGRAFGATGVGVGGVDGQAGGAGAANMVGAGRQCVGRLTHSSQLSGCRASLQCHQRWDGKHLSREDQVGVAANDFLVGLVYLVRQTSDFRPGGVQWQ